MPLMCSKYFFPSRTHKPVINTFLIMQSCICMSPETFIKRIRLNIFFDDARFRRMTFADKTTLGQSAVLGIMWINELFPIPLPYSDENNPDLAHT